MRTYALSTFSFCTLDSSYLFACVPCIEIVEPVPQGRHIVKAVCAVHAIGNSYEPDIIAWEDDFEQPVCFKVVSAKSGLVFDDDRAYKTILYIVHHLNIRRTGIVRTAEAVIDIQLDVFEAVFLCVLSQHQPLVF